MNLSGAELKKLVKAIVSAYPTKNDLEMMVQFELEENLNHRDSFSDCEQLKVENKSEIITDKNLSNLPKITINFLQQSLIKANKSIKRIHILLQSELMNHDFDCWKTE
ncbi:effector-associated domain EAD1-containing protein [Nostoc sp. C117]|uniref:effector-associated domain EAD1-containing protein n=1 Tax=Nostoc sp. C117 TaxID=3349875 RepID=UPI00370D2D86